MAERLLRQVDVARERITVVPHGVGDEFRRPAPEGDIERLCAGLNVRPGSFLLTVGNLSTRKNLATLVRAMGKVEATGPVLVLAGRPGTSSVELNDEIRRRGMTDRVRLAGFVPDADLPALPDPDHGRMQGSCLLLRVGALRQAGGFDDRFVHFYEDDD